MPIEYIGEEDYFEEIIIDGQRFEAEDENTFTVPTSLLRGVKLEEINPNITINVCEKVEDEIIFITSIPYSIKNLDNTNAEILFEDSGRRKFWDGQVGFKLYMETKRDIILERQQELGDIHLDSYGDDGDYIFINYSITVEAETLGLLIQQAEQIIKEIEGAAELTLGSPFKEVGDAENEADFAISILVPLLRKMGFSDVRYNHGKKEYGKDIIFSRRTEFDEYEYWGVQVKFGDVSGGVNSDIDTLVGQAEDAFKMPFYDVYTRSRQRISKLLIAISGKFTENAVEKICEKIESHPLKNNIVFVDGEKIKTLAEKFRR
jgi:hypothetical protein